MSNFKKDLDNKFAAVDLGDPKRVADLFSVVLETCSEAIFVTDSLNRIVATNSAFTELTGYSAEEVRGQNPRILASGYETRQFYNEMWRSIRETGRWEGQVLDRRKSGAIYQKHLSINTLRNAAGKITHYVGCFVDISGQMETERKLHHLKYHDGLTGLPNRALLMDRLGEAILRSTRGGTGFAVLLLDLDHFKVINDSLGHAAGDKVLLETTMRLRSCLRETDTICRLGGDEFIFIGGDINSAEQASVFAAKINEALSRPHEIGGKKVIATASIGIALFPNDGDDPETLVKNADIAMYQSKKTGRRNFQLFDSALTVGIRYRLTIDEALREAIDANQLQLYFQPQLHLPSSRISGVEALIRWQHPDLGLISPARFIPIAEETGLIVQIGQWVLREACRQAHQIRKLVGCRTIISINVSALQLRQESFADDVAQALSEFSLPTETLELEITESAVMQDTARMLSILARLRSIGVRLAIDDFGTGYSSLSYLKRFPINTLKIDQSFVRDMTTDHDAAAIVDAIIKLAHSLRLSIVAEGVESAEQKSFLVDRNCEVIQGYLLSRPMPIMELVKFVAPDVIGGSKGE